MNSEQFFLKKICELWEENLELTQELKKYKDMWRELVDLNKKTWEMWMEFRENYGNRNINITISNPTESYTYQQGKLKELMNDIEQKYFPPPTIDEIDKFTKELMDFHKKLWQKYFGEGNV